MAHNMAAYPVDGYAAAVFRSRGYMAPAPIMSLRPFCPFPFLTAHGFALSQTGKTATGATAKTTAKKF